MLAQRGKFFANFYTLHLAKHAQQFQKLDVATLNLWFI